MRKDRVLAGALAAVTALSMTACGGGQAGGTTQAAAAGTQAAAENTANPNAETTLSIGYTTAFADETGCGIGDSHTGRGCR